MFLPLQNINICFIMFIYVNFLRFSFNYGIVLDTLSVYQYACRWIVLTRYTFSIMYELVD